MVQLVGFIPYLNILDKLPGFKLVKPVIEEVGQTKVLPKSKKDPQKFLLDTGFTIASQKISVEQFHQSWAQE